MGGVWADTTETSPVPTGTLLWQIGLADDLSSEFKEFNKGAETVEIASVGTVLDATASSQISRGIKASSNSPFDINYPLDRVPANGVLFTFKLIRAPKSGSQMAVFSNGQFAGLIQLWGTAGTEYPYQWRKTYRLYIPKEMVRAGKNELRLTAPRPLWGDPADDNQQWCEWDYLKLEALDAPISEPWHGKISYLGTTMTMSDHDFNVNDDTLRFAPVALEWLGIAYSGNTLRANFWYNEAPQQPKRVEYLRLLAAYNMTVLCDFISGGHFRNEADGSVPVKMKDALSAFFQNEGQYIQYYELGNEPCMFGDKNGGGLAEYLSLAKEIQRIRPAHLKIVAPGWAYGGNKGGLPLNWDAFVDNRRAVEKYCDCIDGHSYGFSFADSRGGSFIKELEDFGEIEDGWPKEYLNSETGSNNWHSEDNGAHQKSAQPHMQSFDRILRAHLAVVDRTMQHAAVFSDFGLFSTPESWAGFDLDQLQVMPPPDGPGKDSRLKTYRRLALAYATHGVPLTYTVQNAADLQYKQVYFRAVNTASLAPQAGSHAVSNKVLLNFVNFETTAQALSVHVILPQNGRWTGTRIGPGDTWGAAHSSAAITALPDARLQESLGPGESVQYILAPPSGGSH